MNKDILPRWIDIGLLPLLNVLAALIVVGILIAILVGHPFWSVVVTV